MEILQADFLRMLKEDKNEGMHLSSNDLSSILLSAYF